MTYREIFDQAIGEAPPSSIDVRRVVTRQRRLVRARRIGMYGTAAGGVVAVALGAGVVLAVALGAGTPAGGPPPGGVVPGGPPSAVTASPGPSLSARSPMPNVIPIPRSEAAERYKAEAVAVLVREAPGLRWANEADSGNPATWTGPTSGTLDWQAREDRRHGGFFFDGIAVDAAAGVGNEVSVLMLSKPQPGMVREPFKCGVPRERSCTLSKGPAGEKIRHLEFTSEEMTGPGPQAAAWRRIDVLHADGTWVRLMLRAPDERFLLTPEKLHRLAFDPAITTG